jgi:hypothetical protein
MSADQKVLIATLWQRTSERGNEYLSGFLGKARVVGFHGEPTPDGVPTWNLYLTPGKEQETGTDQRPRAAAAKRQPRKVGPRPPAQPGPTAADRPFHSDPLDHLWPAKGG